MPARRGDAGAAPVIGAALSRPRPAGQAGPLSVLARRQCSDMFGSPAEFSPFAEIVQAPPLGAPAL